MVKKLFRLFLLLFIISSCLTTPAVAQRHSFALGDSVFLLDNKPFQIISGEIHYSRVPEAYWQDRLHKAKAMGLNTVAVYLMWNMHEPEKGRWDFTGRQDVRRFIELAKKEGLHVILRPGPYVCAEWEFGGYPWWLLKDKDIQVRTNDPRFMEPAKAYLMKIGHLLSDLQIDRGGPIIMVQVENEYGSFGKDTAYERQVANDLKEAGFTVPFFTADGDWLFKNAALPGILPGANGEYDPEKLKKSVDEYHNGKGPYFVPELYPGWLDHWGEKFQTVPTKEVVDNVKRLLDAGVSINFYMWHGGTNFGFMNGANYNKEHPIQPDITSYDYDAPLSESGFITDKYLALRKLLEQYQQSGTILPPVPENPKYISIPIIKLDRVALLFDNLPKPVNSIQLHSMEDLNQGYGYILYRTKLNGGGEKTLHIERLRDYAQVFINGKSVGTLNRMYGEKDLKINASKGARLDILVENLGRINFGHELMNNRKGIIGSVSLEGKELTGWQIYSLPFKHGKDFHFKTNNRLANVPAVFSGSFHLDKTGDTFLDMRDWGKGIVFVNGHNLGRYWNIGPQQTLYLPGPWLRKGENKIRIFEQLGKGQSIVSGIDHPILDQLKLEINGRKKKGEL